MSHINDVLILLFSPQMKLRDGIRIAMAVSAEGNKFITETEPFKVIKTNKEHAATLVAAGE